MAARDKYEIEVKCENCKTKGIIGISEDDYPFMRSLRRRVDYVKGEFTAQMKGEFKVLSVCKKCNREIISFDQN